MKDTKPIIGLFVKDNENRIDDAEENVYVAAVEQSGGVAFNAFRQLSAKRETDNPALCVGVTTGYTKKSPNVVQ